MSNLNLTVDQAVVARMWQELGLRPLTANALAREGLDSVEELRTRSQRHLARIPNIGEVALKDIGKLFRGESTNGAHRSLEDIADSVLVMEMLRRGYAVSRVDGT